VQLIDASKQLHPLPLNAVAVNPDGKVSAIVTVPLVGPAPMLDTVSVYAAPV
jgi:hypothetical protein